MCFFDFECVFFWIVGFINQDDSKGYKAVSVLFVFLFKRNITFCHIQLLFHHLCYVMSLTSALLAGASSTANNALLSKGGMNVFIKDLTRCPPICL